MIPYMIIVIVSTALKRNSFYKIETEQNANIFNYSRIAFLTNKTNKNTMRIIN